MKNENINKDVIPPAFHRVTRKVFFIIFPLVTLIIIFLFFSAKNSKEYFNDIVIDQEYSGKIIKRYIDEENHYEETIYIDIKGEEHLIIGEWIELYNLSEIGDNITKEKGIGHLILTKQDGTAIRISYDTNSPGYYVRPFQ